MGFDSVEPPTGIDPGYCLVVPPVMDKLGVRRVRYMFSMVVSILLHPAGSFTPGTLDPCGRLYETPVLTPRCRWCNVTTSGPDRFERPYKDCLLFRMVPNEARPANTPRGSESGEVVP